MQFNIHTHRIANRVGAEQTEKINEIARDIGLECKSLYYRRSVNKYRLLDCRLPCCEGGTRCIRMIIIIVSDDDVGEGRSGNGADPLTVNRQ